MLPREYYKNSLENLDVKIKNIKKKELIISFIKIFLIIIIFFFIINYKIYTVYPFMISSVLFLTITIFHEKIIKKRKLQISSKNIDEVELDVLNYEFKDLDNGNEFINVDHNYSDDLDLFGNGGLFQYINRAKTSMGRKKLADLLRNGIEITELENYQNAVIELSDRTEFRRRIQIYSENIEDDSKKRKQFIEFFNTPNTFTSNKFLLIILKIIPILTLGSLYLSFTGTPFSIFLGFFVFQLCFNLVYAKKNTVIHRLSKKSYMVLKVYSNIIKEIETNEFINIKLLNLKKNLFIDNKKASYYIRKLAVFLEWFELRNSSIHFLINNIFFWDLNLARKIEVWRSKVADNVNNWFSIIGEFESISSFANLYYNNPDWTFPVFSNDVILKAEGLGHPLINENERVINDLSFDTGNVMIITGPNMAGKSTFLRSIGVNIILAQAGAPVCCKNLILSSFDIYTSMKISDSLDKKMSLFYAELSRLKKIIDGLKNKKKIFFLIDEMLKGTNVIDRQKGSLALMKQLIENGANGILATHDLKLSELEGKYKKKNKLFNYHFDSFIKGDNLEFDYKLRDGVCKSFNAHILMKNMGIEI